MSKDVRCFIILVGLILVTVTAPTYAASVSENSGRIIIGFKMDAVKHLDEKMVSKIISSAKIKCKIIHVDSVLKFAVIETTEDIKSVRSKLLRNSIVEYVELDYIYHAIGSSKYIPNDPYLEDQWGLFSINAPEAWDIERGDSSIIVAVVDTGIDYTHPDLAANYQRGGYDFVNGDHDPLDDNGHGTHCAGIIAAVMNNGVGVAGVAHVKIMAEKVLDARGIGYSSWIARGIVHAANNGAKIISMSLGSSLPSLTIQRACQYAWFKGCLLFAAAGNEGLYGVDYPARFRTVVAVGAINSDRTKAWFSNYGTGLELVAPGVNILSTMPTYPVYLNVTEGIPLNYAYLSGTSMACPFAAGVAALVWSHYPNMTNLKVRVTIDRSTADLGKSGWDIYYGFGEVNAYYALLNASTFMSFE